MKIETKFNRDQKVIVIYDSCILEGKVDGIRVEVGFKGRIKIMYDVKLKVELQELYEPFDEGDVFESLDDLKQQAALKIYGK